MQVNSVVFRVIQLLVVAMVLLIVAGMVIFFLRFDAKTTAKDTGLEAVTLRLQRSAFSYYAKLQEYTGVCSDIGIPDDYTCRESESAFVVYTRLSSGSSYCADDTGFIGEVDSVASSALACQN